MRAHGEYVENEAGAVEDFHFQFALDVAQLLGGELIVEDDHAHFTLGLFFGFDVAAYFLKFSFTQIGHRARAVQPLREAFHGNGARRFGQKFQFVQIFRRFALVLVFGDEGHQYGGFRFGFRLYEFFHVCLMIYAKIVQMLEEMKQTGLFF